MKVSRICTRFSEDFNLNGTRPIYFLKSEWEAFDPDDDLSYGYGSSRSNSPVTVSWPYLAYRFIYMCFFITVTVENMLCDIRTQKLDLYFIYLTNCSFTIQLIYSTLYFIVLLWNKLCPTRSKFEDFENNNADESTALVKNNSNVSVHFQIQSYQTLPFVYKILWILINIVNALPYGTSLIYWSFIYAGPEPETCENVSTFILHAGNSVTALLDNLVIAVPIRLSHVIFPFLTASGYIIFSILYDTFNGVYEEGQEYIYPILNWRNKPGIATMTSIAGVLCVLAMHPIFCWGVSKIRVNLVKKYSL